MIAAPAAPGRRLVGKPGVLLLLVLSSAFALLNIAELIAIWPVPPAKQTASREPGGPPEQPQAASPSAGPGAAAEPQPGATSEQLCPKEGGRLGVGPWSFCPNREQRLLLIVFLAGALGGAIHALRSFGWYVGNRLLVWSWVPWYLLLPLLGSLASVVFYVVIRGGFFSPQAGDGESANPFGFAAFAALVGLFTNQAILKLEQTFETLLASREQGKDRIDSALKVTAISPAAGPQAGATEVAITGSGFATSGVRVRFGSKDAASVAVQSQNELTAVTPPQAPGVVDVELINPDNQNFVLRQSFTYTA